MRQIYKERPRGTRPGDARGSFHDLMQWRVGRVLLVSSLYDSFMLAEDRLAEELVLGEFLGVELSMIPDITRVSTGAEALEAVQEPPGYDLVISSPNVGDMHAGELAQSLREGGLEVPVIMLAYHERELRDTLQHCDLRGIDRSFLFQGNIELFLAIVKYAEDRMNVQHDVEAMGVQVILVIEDNIRYYSHFLPVIYTVLLRNTASLVPDGLNLAHKLLRAKARPKILLASNYEQACRDFDRYEKNILGVISDVEFPKAGELCADAGVQFARHVLERQADVPVVLDSGRAENAELAAATGTSFLHKYSPTLLQDLRSFMQRNFGFGDFVFQMPEGNDVARARDLRDLERLLHEVPPESLVYHAGSNHFSTWLKAHTEFDIAYRLRPRRLSEFAGPEALRKYLVGAIRGHREARRRALVMDFDPERYDPDSGFAKIGGGSLGGKARGLAFGNRLLTEFDLRDQFPGARVVVPPSVVIGTDVFDEYLDNNEIRDAAIKAQDDATVERAFAAAEFPPRIRAELLSYLEVVRYPLAVRSSSLLEDAKYQPFSGVYDTVMIANDHPEIDVRLDQLIAAVKRIYASVFCQRAKRYIAATSYRLDAEKMAVILQRVVGAAHGNRFYPEIAGVALSQNFYPVEPVTPDDGLAAVALGMGAEVVGGESCMRFSPRHPLRLLQMSSVKDALRNSQRQFYALQLGGLDADAPVRTDLDRFDLRVADDDGTLSMIGSTYSPDNDVIYDGVTRPGIRLVSFAPMLKYHTFPLAEILSQLLDIGRQSAGGHVEIEFAINLSTPPGQPKEFAFLQLRPVVHTHDPESIRIDASVRERALCESDSVLGTGRIEDVHDLIVVDYGSYDRSKSPVVAQQVATLNARLVAKGIPYALIGVGRWGSSDRFLGIPVTWDQIAGARVIVEAGLRDMRVTPSQGTHFFQNLVANNVGYFTTNPEAGDGRVDWEWLAAQPAASETEFVRHLHFPEPCVVLMNGNANEGVILKPA